MAETATSSLVFFGTPELALPTLDALVAAGRAPRLVVTQPARPAGRGQRLSDPPVARRARELGLPVLQPERVRDPQFLSALAAAGPWDAAVVVAFGQIFPRALLDLPAHGCINLHASLLPAHRGAAPIQAAIAAGEEKTGVTTMLMEAGLDTGPILLQRETPIGPEETAGELGPRLAALGGELMVATLAALERGEIVPMPQREELASYAPRLSRESGRVDWGLPAAKISNRLRAFTPWPGATAALSGTPVKLLAARPEPPEAGEDRAPGTVLGLREGRLAVACGGGTALGITLLQRPGKRALAAADFARGEQIAAGERFS